MEAEMPAGDSAFSMPEMPVTREDHRHVRGIGGGDDFLVTDGAAGLDELLALPPPFMPDGYFSVIEPS
jgi:hypothetical protein